MKLKNGRSEYIKYILELVMKAIILFTKLYTIPINNIKQYKCVLMFNVTTSS